MKDLATRTVTGAVLLVLLYGSLFLGKEAYFAFFLLLTIAGILEFFRLVKTPATRPQVIPGLLVGILIYGLLFFIASGSLPSGFLILVFPLILLLMFVELFRNTQNPIINIGYTILGIIYVAVPFGLLAKISFFSVDGNPSYSPWLTGGFFLLIMMNDTAAYLVGVPLGKNRLFERVSPKKSWEGAIGGMLFTLLLAYFLSRYLEVISFTSWLIIAFLVVVFGSLGDLVESMFKRCLNKKDSGSIFPGHGGILDRYDAVFLSAPFVVAYLELFL